MDMVNAVGALFIFVGVYDTQALLRGKPTISADYRGILEDHPIATLAGTAYLLAHLTNQPKQFRRFDLLSGYAHIFGKRV